MSYTKQTFLDKIVDGNGNVVQEGTTLKAEHLNHIEEGIIANEAATNALGDTINNSVMKAIDKIDVSEGDLIYTGPFTLGYVGPNDGVVQSSTNLAHTERISVSEGDVITVTAKKNGETIKRNVRMLTAYLNNIVIPTAGGQNFASYIVPAGVDSVIVTAEGFSSGTGETNQTVTVTRSVDSQFVYYPTREPLRAWYKHGNLADGTSFEFPEQNVKMQKVFVFSGNITSFHKLVIGRKVGGTYKERVEIGPTSLTFYDTYGASKEQEHGLNISGNIQVEMVTKETNRLDSMIISSCGLRYKATNLHNIPWNADMGIPSVTSEGSELTDCAAMWSCRTKNKPVWVFGDSYLTFASSRWIHYLIEDGFAENCMVNGYAGENSTSALTALKNLLQIGRPQYILWCLGMNDKDTDTAVNGNWQSVYNQLIQICDNYKVTPVLATIPNTPTVNNSYKNAVVKSSGHRYVDFSAAVNLPDSNEWISGALSEDNVHPTEHGAVCLYHRVLTDFPEITNL